LDIKKQPVLEIADRLLLPVTFNRNTSLLTIITKSKVVQNIIADKNLNKGEEKSVTRSELPEINLLLLFQKISPVS
jgi:hypothetical protein